MLLEQLLAELDVLGLGVRLAQASVDLLLPLVVLGFALRSVSFRPSKVLDMFQHWFESLRRLLDFVISVGRRWVDIQRD